MREHRQECLSHSGLEAFGEGVERRADDGGAQEGVEFARRIDGLHGFAQSFGDAIKAEFESFENVGLLGLDESFLAAFLAAFLAELLCDGHGFLS